MFDKAFKFVVLSTFYTVILGSCFAIGYFIGTPSLHTHPIPTYSAYLWLTALFVGKAIIILRT